MFKLCDVNHECLVTFKQDSQQASSSAKVSNPIEAIKHKVSRESILKIPANKTLIFKVFLEWQPCHLLYGSVTVLANIEMNHHFLKIGYISSLDSDA